jgi:hypothetical protein
MAESGYAVAAMGKHEQGLDTYIVDCHMGLVEYLGRVDRMK